MKIKCLIVDDEPPARDLLAAYIARLDDLEVCGQCGTATEAFSFLQKNEVDLLFLDIRMPRMSGIELIKSLLRRPQIVITTAYRDYAVEGFDLEVLDYLVKPVSFERFLKSIARYHHLLPDERPPEKPASDAFEQAYLFFKVDRNMVKVFLKDILYIESIRDYLKIVTAEKTHVTYLRLGYMEEKLPEGHFVRIHKSFIVPLAKIEAFRHDTVKIVGHQLPVGRVYKQGLTGAMERSGVRYEGAKT